MLRKRNLELSEERHTIGWLRGCFQSVVTPSRWVTLLGSPGGAALEKPQCAQMVKARR